MTDVLTPAQRAYNMSQIKSGNTKPEIYLRDILVSNNLSDFQMRPKEIPGKPDFYFPYRKAVIFVDGCFWHGCKKCYVTPKTNAKFWDTKIKSNQKRDKIVNKELKELGNTVVRIKEHDIKKNPEGVLENIMNSVPKYDPPKVLDLFAGAGGLSEGFVKAGCEMIGHVEMDKDSCETILTRMVYHELLKRGRMDEYKSYILGKISRDDIIEKHGLQKEKNSVICAKIDKNSYGGIIDSLKERLGGKSLDIIVGGPPCQAYSHIGRAVDQKNMKWDSRKFLFRYYVEFLKALKPKIFVFENVPGLVSSGEGKYLREMRKLMKKTGYDTDYRIHNTVNFGVPQNRRRVILVGWSDESKLDKYPEFPTVLREYLVGDFLNDLPRIKAGEGNEITHNFNSVSNILHKLSIANSNLGILMDHVARPNSKRDLEIYRLAVQRKTKGENIKYNELPPRLKTHKNETVFLDRFRVVDSGAKGSQTILAHIGKDGHYYIHPDIKQNRSLTVREAARLQTFPDDYKFEGNRGSKFKQIGNAVPPMFSAVIASELVKYI